MLSAGSNNLANKHSQNTDVMNRHFLEIILKMFVFVAGGGISNYTEHPEGAGASLVTCLKEARDIVPVTSRSTTPIWLGATAGMRLLRSVSEWGKRSLGGGQRGYAGVVIHSHCCQSTSKN